MAKYPKKKQALVKIKSVFFRPIFSIIGPATMQPKKHPKLKMPVIQDACWLSKEKELPYKSVPSGFIKEGMAGALYPITVPLRKHPKVAQKVAKTYRNLSLEKSLQYHEKSPFFTCFFFE